MHVSKIKDWIPSAWQVAFLVLGTTWLAAPFLNSSLSRRLTLISQYELPVEPYSWLFRMGDILSALLLLAAAVYLYRRLSRDNLPRFIYVALLTISITMLLDPLVSATCKIDGRTCVPFLSTSFVVHAFETLASAFVVFGLSVYDAIKNKNLVSTLFVVFQLLYTILFFTKLAATYRFATLSQVIYQVLVIVWLAWYVGNLANRWLKKEPILSAGVAQNIRRAFAVWAYLNGTLAILLSLVHIRLFGFLRNIYFAGNTSWLSQHGVVVGVLMLYLSRHIARGEHRARQLFLVLLFIETIKYAAVTPDLDLLALYGVTFALLFASRPLFRRGSVAPDWHLRLQEAALVLSGVAVAGAVVVYLVNRSKKLYGVYHDAFSHFNAFVLHSDHIPRHLLRSSLVAHTIAVLAVVTSGFLLWSLFRPAKNLTHRTSRHDREEAEKLLQRYAINSEDFFKVWPHDKYYFWSSDRQSFVAYTVVDSLVYALADPVAASGQARASLLKDFIHHWHSRAYTTCFLMVSESTLEMYQDAGLSTLQIGSSAIIDVNEFVTEIANDKWWRWQKNRSVKAGYTYSRSAPPHSNELLQQCRTVSSAWLERPGHRERGFALGTFSEAYLQQCTLHYLTDETGQIIAFTNQVPNLHGLHQTTVDMMRYLPDKNNAMPFLLSNLINTLAEEGQFSHFDLGYVPLAKMDNVLVSIAKTLASRQVSAAGLEQFKGKFKPVWQKNYLAYDGDLGDLATIALRVEEAMRPE